MEGIRSLPPVRLEGLTNRNLLDYFANTWELYELLFGAIESDDSLYLNPDPLRHPLIFYLGHTAVFYLNKLKLAGVLEAGFNDEFEDLFERGIDPSSPEQIPSFDWPPVAAARDYRRQVYEYLVDKLTTLQIPALVTAEDDEMWALLMGLEHLLGRPNSRHPGAGTSGSVVVVLSGGAPSRLRLLLLGDLTESA